MVRDRAPVAVVGRLDDDAPQVRHLRRGEQHRDGAHGVALEQDAVFREGSSPQLVDGREHVGAFAAAHRRVSAFAAAMGTQVHEQDRVATLEVDRGMAEVGVEGVAEAVDDHDRGLLGPAARQPCTQPQPLRSELRFLVGRTRDTRGPSPDSPDHDL